MDKDAKQKKNEYQKEWREKNKDKVKGYIEKYWSKKATQKEGSRNV